MKTKRFFSLLALLLSFSAITHATRAENGSAVVLIYNKRVAESKAVAEHYAAMRQVPADQIFGFDLTKDETISRRDFREDLQRPLIKKLAATGLYGSKIPQSSIRYLVLCYGMPLKISEDTSLKETVPAALPEQLRRNEAAVDSELACLPQMDKGMIFTGPLSNPNYGATNGSVFSAAHGIFMVARLDGPTPATARALVDKAMSAETNGLWGRAYFDLRGLATNDVAYVGDEWMRTAALVCQSLGLETTVDLGSGTFPASFPMSQIAFYAGWYDENVSGPFAQPTVEFMPGAFAYHLHSFSAATIRSETRQWVGPLLAKGATATMGCVNEPFLGGTPNMGIFFTRFIYNSFSFGEAAYACQAYLSWQTTVVGDPLYRPYARSLVEIQQDLKNRNSPLIDWCYLRNLNANLFRGAPVAQLSLALQGLDRTPQSSILEEKLAALDLSEGKPNSSAETLRKALKLETTPNQRMRILLQLGHQLADLDRDEEAFTVYQEFAKQFPDYSDMLAIDRSLLGLAKKLNHQQDIDFYQKEITRLTPAKTP